MLSLNTSRRRQVGIVVILLLGLVIFSVTLGTSGGQAQPSLISADVAVAAAINSARYGAPYFDGMKGEPTEIRGKLMTFDEADLFVQHRPLDRGSLVGKEWNKPVWLIVLKVDTTGYRPAALPAPGQPPRPPEVIKFSYLVQYVDANTARIFQGARIPAGSKFDAGALPVLRRPTGTVVIPSLAPQSPVPPVATKGAAPKSP